jgi:hypothetical protein
MLTGLTAGHPSANTQGTMTSVYNLGCFAGALSTIFTGDWLGRPRQILLGSTIIAIGAVIQTASWTVPQVIIMSSTERHTSNASADDGGQSCGRSRDRHEHVDCWCEWIHIVISLNHQITTDRLVSHRSGRVRRARCKAVASLSSSRWRIVSRDLASATGNFFREKWMSLIAATTC